jgi:Hsp20/alpha crystallin family
VSKDDIQVQVVTSPLQYELRITAKRSYMSIDSTSCVSTNMKSQRYCINHNVVDVTQINATLHNGVLTIIAPKKKVLNTNESSITDMDASKDNSTQEMLHVTRPMTAEYNKEKERDSSANGEGHDMNAIIHIAVSEE